MNDHFLFKKSLYYEIHSREIFLLEDKRYSVYLKNREKLQGLEKSEIATSFRRRISQIYKR